MTAHWIVFMALRHLRTRRTEQGHMAVALSIGGIAAGVMTLTAVLSVMNGFQLGTIDNILEVGSYHLRLDGAPRSEDIDASIRSTDGVIASMPFRDIQTLIQTEFSNPLGIHIRAVPTDALRRDAGFDNRIEMHSGEFDLLRPNGIVIGVALAQLLGVSVGNSVIIVPIPEGGRLQEVKRLIVRGIFRTGYLEYDQSWGYLSLEQAERLFGDDRELLWGVKLRDRYADRVATERLHEALLRGGVEPTEFEIASWRSFNRAIFSALRLEKSFMIVLVGLIFVVVAFNIYQSLRRSVVERSEQIAVLKALGAAPADIQAVFIFEGGIIGLSGAAIGIAIGLLVGGRVNDLFSIAELIIEFLLRLVNIVATSLFAGSEFEYAFFSPSYFYIEEIPSRISLADCLGIFAFAILSAFCAAWLASRHIAVASPTQVLRHE